MRKINPISHIFKESVLAEDITFSDGLEARTCELKLNKTNWSY